MIPIQINQEETESLAGIREKLPSLSIEEKLAWMIAQGYAIQDEEGGVTYTEKSGVETKQYPLLYGFGAQTDTTWR